MRINIFCVYSNSFTIVWRLFFYFEKSSAVWLDIEIKRTVGGYTEEVRSN